MDEPPPEPADSGRPRDGAPLGVVGIGASAGGLESLERFFANVPPTSGLAFVVVQHLSPDFQSMMDELLARRTSLPIVSVTDGMAVEPDRIHLMPSGKEMVLAGGRLWLTDRETGGLSLPIDRFFQSLANDLREAAVAIVLSGSGSDGSRGVVAVKEAGGLVLVESERTARFASMPQSAQETGAVDHVLVPDAMPQALMDRLRGVDLRDRVPPPEGYDAILHLLRKSCGIDFGHYKPTTVTRRIERRLGIVDEESVDRYALRLRDDPAELEALHRDLLIDVTSFFRDSDAFERLEREVLPRLLERVADGEEMRIWIAGCATGEEAYSIAMLTLEVIEALGREVKLKIFATDVHRASLERASAGVYSAEEVEPVGEERLRRWFVPVEERWRVRPELRQAIVFAPHDLTRNAPFTQLHLVTCRNLLIYLQPPTQRKVLLLFHFALKQGGVMFLGRSETPGELLTYFDTVHEHDKMYVKKAHAPLPPDLRLSMSGGPRIEAPEPVAAQARTRETALLDTYDRLLERFMPPSLLLGPGRELVDSFAGAERYLRVTPRRPSRSALDMIAPELRPALVTALTRLDDEGRPVRIDGVTLGDERLRLLADGVPRPHGPRYVLVSLERVTAEPAEAGAGDGPVVARADGVREMEAELRYAKESLQTTVEELETSNEELQSTNEELVAANEELQSTNEELHSVNEELYTVNAEYQKKIAELKQLHADVSHLLESTGIATIFLDRDLRIRKFTPRIAETFDLLPQDLGRRLGAFSHRLDLPDLLDVVERVRDRGEPFAEDVYDRSGRCWFLHVLPYRTDQGVEGVVVTLTDISELEDARRQLRRLSEMVSSAHDAIVGVDLEGRVTDWNDAARRLYGYELEEVAGRHFTLLVPEHGRPQFEETLRRVRAGDHVQSMEAQRRCKDGALLHVSVTVSPIRDRHGRIVGAASIARDVSALKEAEERLRQSEARYQDLYQHAPDMYLSVSVDDGRVEQCNETLRRRLGWAAEEVVGRPWLDLCVPECRDAARKAMERLRESGEVHDVELAVRGADGAVLHVSASASGLRDGTGEIRHARTVLRDIGARKRAERGLRTALQQREQFLAMLSHELRNPLNAICNALAILDRTSDVELAERTRDLFKRQTRHMTRLLDDLLDVTRITRNRFEVRLEPLDLRATVADAVASVEPLAGARDVRIETAVPETEVSVHGDPDRLQQVQANLLSNAVKYSPPGSRVRLELRVEGAEAVLCVRDEGVGIPADMLERVFDMFAQCDRDVDREQGGLGLGLTLCRTIVDRHEGRIHARSAGPGRGTELEVRLPLSARAAARHSRDEAGGELARALRVVVVEDMPDNRMALRMLLELKGCEVHEAEDGARGLALIREQRPDVALVDIGLPSMSGYEVARALRGEDGGTHLVALTGYGRDSDVERAREAGFDEHFVKPIDPESLERLLARCGAGGAEPDAGRRDRDGAGG